MAIITLDVLAIFFCNMTDLNTLCGVCYAIRYQRVRVMHIARHVLLLYITRRLFSDVCIKLWEGIQRLILFVRNLMEHHPFQNDRIFNNVYFN